MKVLVIGGKERFVKYTPHFEIVKDAVMIFCERGTSDREILAAADDADFIFADAISPVSRYLMEHLPSLKMVHSEGVAFNQIDVNAAKEMGIYVCNNKGCNAGAVAEQTILLMLALLRSTVLGDEAVRAGHQIEMKEKLMVRGITELGDCKIGLIGFGDIAKATAKRLQAFECEVYYFDVYKQTAEVEDLYHVKYLELEEIASICDIISIHAPVTNETTGMINKEFLSRMKSTAYLINTARGEIVDNLALRESLVNGTIAGAGLDTIHPEPTTKDNPLVDLPADCKYKVVYSPHLGGITLGFFRRAHENIWINVEKIMNGQKPGNIVNGL